MKGRTVNMSKTNFSDKCQILGDLWLLYRGDIVGNEAWEDFFAYNDIALPMSYLISIDLVEAKDGASDYINETWDMFCEYIEIDAEEEYHSIAEAFDASSRPPLASE